MKKILFLVSVIVFFSCSKSDDFLDNEKVENEDIKIFKEISHLVGLTHRDQVLTTVIGGSEYDNATYLHNGLNLSVRRVASRFEYFFDIYYTNL
jgi:hypothetical protein